ncbi:MAG: hypothetical protein R6U89_08365 [Dehalococcoidia bacterium]
MSENVPLIYCNSGVGCNLEIVTEDNGNPVKTIHSGRKSEVNNGFLRIKGSALQEMMISPNWHELHLLGDVVI